MKYENILFDIQDKIATLTFNLPESRNPISGEGLIGEIEDACRKVQFDNSVSVMIITGAGKAFSAGGNVKKMRERNQASGGGPLEIQESYRRGIQRIPLAIDAVDVPIIAAVNGAAIGAGCDTAMMCDIRIASTFAKFGETFLNLGLIPGDGGSWFLTRLVGYAKMAELTFTGKVIDAQEALRIGLVNEVWPNDELQDRAKALAKELAAMPPVAVAGLLKCVIGAGDKSLEEGIAEERRAVMSTMGTKDQQEGMMAFLEKRKPVFTGE